MGPKSSLFILWGFGRHLFCFSLGLHVNLIILLLGEGDVEDTVNGLPGVDVLYDTFLPELLEVSAEAVLA